MVIPRADGQKSLDKLVYTNYTCLRLSNSTRGFRQLQVYANQMIRMRSVNRKPGYKTAI